MTIHVSLRIAAVAVALLAVGCSGGDSGGGSSASSASSATAGGSTTAGGAATPGSTVPSQPRPGGWLKGDLHVHSEFSDDAGRYGSNSRTLSDMGQYAGLDFMVVSDHRQTTILQDPVFLQAQAQASLTLIAGMEWGGSGHAGAHGLVRTPPFVTQTGADAAAELQSVNDVIDDVHQQGGFFVLNHPVDPKNPFGWPATGFDGIEVWNSMWSVRSVADATPQSIQNWAAGKGFAAAGLSLPPELLAGAAVQGGGQNHQGVKFWEAHLNQGRHLAAVGGGDHHYLVLPGRPTTYVFAASRSQADVIQAIREARTMVARAPDAPIVDFRADANGDGVFESGIGDSMPLNQTIDFQIRVVDAVGGKVNLIRNGQLVQSFPVSQLDQTFTFTDTPTSRSWYRLDVLERIDLSFPHANSLKLMVTGTAGQNWISQLNGLGGIFSGVTGWITGALSQVQDVVASGATVGVWLLIYGNSMGVTIAPTSTQYPVVEWPEHVDKVLNIDMTDPDFCRSVVTSPIWAE